MQVSRILNSVGLVLGMIGVVMLFVWGPPQPSFPESVGIAVEPNTVLNDGRKVADMIEADQREKRKYEVRSRVGLGLVGIGFMVQLVAVWI